MAKRGVEKKCPRCGEHPAVIDRSFGVLPCKQCQKEDEEHTLHDKPEFWNISKHNRIQRQRDTHAKDMLQPFEDGKGTPNRDFVEAYPDKREDYFTDESLKKL